MKCLCGNSKMTKAGERQRVRGRRQVFYCPKCGRTLTVPMPKPRKARGVSLKSSTFVEGE